MGNTASFFGFSAPDLAGDAFDFGMAKYQQSQNNAAADKANQFSEQMSNTSWQRGVADMRAAGINPMLAASQGGASAPTGQQAAVPNFNPGAGGSASSFSAQQLASVDNTKANTLATLASLPSIAATTDLKRVSAELVKQQGVGAGISNTTAGSILAAKQRMGKGFWDVNALSGLSGAGSAKAAAAVLGANAMESGSSSAAKGSMGDAVELGY